MNSVLQVFFSIPTFRNAIFDWKQVSLAYSDGIVEVFGICKISLII